MRVLEKAGLIEKTQHGRESIMRCNPVQVQQASDWISYYIQFWNHQFDAVDDYLQQPQKDTNDTDE